MSWRKINRINTFILIVAVFLTSCSNGDSNDFSKNFIEIIETNENGISENTVFSYHENQIISSDNSKEKIEYTYNNGLITKVVKYNKETQLNTTLEYTYLKGKLVKAKSVNNYVIYYTHNADATVTYERYKIGSENQELKVNHGTLFFNNRNLVKDERFFDNVSEGIVAGSKTSFEYDAYNNPYKSILGFDKLLDRGALVSKNNVVITIVETTVENDDGTITSANIYRTNFKYDSDDYPTEQLSEASVGNPNYSKIQYLY